MDTYNPLLGEEYILIDHKTKKKFSNLPERFWIQEGVLKELPNWKDKLFSCCYATSTMGFVSVVPWVPYGKKLKKRLEQEFPNVIESQSSLFFYCDLTMQTLERILSIRSELGGDVGGEWCIGGILDSFDFTSSKAQMRNLRYFLAESKKIGCLLHLGEMQQVFFMSRHFEGLEELIEMET